MPELALVDSPATGDKVTVIDIADHIRNFTDYGGQNIPVDQKHKIIAVALARALSLHLQLPSSPVISIYTHYADKCGKFVDDMICKINESYVIDCKLVSDLTFKFYKLRYDLVFTPDTIGVFFANLANIPNDYISEQLIKATGCACTEQNAHSFGTLVKNVSYTLKSKLYGDEGKVMGSNVL